MKKITSGNEKQIKYATELREKAIAGLLARSADRREPFFERRLAKLKAAHLADCTDAPTLIDWCKDGFHNGIRIISLNEWDDLRVKTLSDIERFKADNPEPEAPTSFPIVPKWKLRKQGGVLPPEQQQAKNEWAEYETAQRDWQNRLEAYLTDCER